MPGPLLRRVLAIALVLAFHAAQAETPLRVALPAGSQGASGRLLVSLQPADVAEKAAKDGKVEAIRISPFGGVDGTVIGMDVPWLEPGRAVVVDGESHAYPARLSALPAGEYYVQAVLDTARDNNYGGDSDDISSLPVKFALDEDGDLPLLALDQRPEAGSDDPWDLPEQLPEAMRAQVLAANDGLHSKLHKALASSIKV